MADITKCTNDKCPIKQTCYRWTAPADPIWQSYCKFEPYKVEDGHYNCGYHIPTHVNHPVTESEKQ